MWENRNGKWEKQEEKAQNRVPQPPKSSKSLRDGPDPTAARPSAPTQKKAAPARKAAPADKPNDIPKKKEPQQLLPQPEVRQLPPTDGFKEVRKVAQEYNAVADLFKSHHRPAPQVEVVTAPASARAAMHQQELSASLFHRTLQLAAQRGGDTLKTSAHAEEANSAATRAAELIAGLDHAST